MRSCCRDGIETTPVCNSARESCRSRVCRRWSGTIEDCATPSPLAAWLKRNRAVEIANASNTGRWVACVSLVALTGGRIRSHKAEKTGETEKQGKP